MSKPQNLTIEDGDLLDLPSAGYIIVHQCNCTSDTISGLAKAVHDKWPESDQRKCRNMPELFGGTFFTKVENGGVIEVYSQLNKGKPSSNDSAKTRAKAFFNAMTCVFDTKPKKIAFSETKTKVSKHQAAIGLVYTYQ